MAVQLDGYRGAIAISVGLHLLLVIMVVFGWETSAEKTKQQTPRYIEAKLVQLKAATPVKKAPQAKAKPKTVDVAKKRREQERLRKKKAEQKRKIDLAKAKKKKAEQAKRDKQQAEKERKAREETQRLQAAEQRHKELDQALAAEEELLEAETLAEMAQSYSALIAQRIRESWSRPPSARNGMECVLLLHLVPSGEVVDVTVVDGSGNGAFDRSAEQAVRRVGHFDELQGMPRNVFEQNFRRFKMRFKPQDLRL